MAKEIILNENSLKRLILREVRYTPSTSDLVAALNKVPNLHTDKYANSEVHSDYKAWEETNFSKDGNEYQEWSNTLRNYLNFLNRSVDYVIRRMTLGITDMFLIDPKWVESLKGKTDDYQCFYTLVLKIYQNKPIWNDLFFNPMFSNISKDITKVMDDISNVKDMEEWNRRKSMLPKEYFELNKYRKNPSNMNEQLFCAPEVDYNEFL